MDTCTQSNAAAIILAGGRSRRMGKDKASLPVYGKTLLEHIYQQLYPVFTQVIISTGTHSTGELPDAQVAVDECGDRGPLQGIVSALKVSVYESNFVTACDMPDIEISVLQRVLSYADGDWDAVVPITSQKQPQPLFALYKKRMTVLMEDTLGRGERSVLHVLSNCNVKYVDMADDDQMFNINTIDDYLCYLRKGEE